MAIQLDTPMGPGFLIFFNEIRVSQPTIPHTGGRAYRDKPGPNDREVLSVLNRSRASKLIAIIEADQWL